MKRVIVIGGGAAGMMAAIASADAGCRVCLIEKNEKLGKKLFITGKGRCNVTNAADIEALFNNICRNVKFLYSALYGYDNRAVMDFFEENGCQLKTERGDRVFPASDHSSDVIAALSRALRTRNVEIMLNSEVRSILTGEYAEHTNIGLKDQNKRRNLPDRIALGVELSGGRKISADSIIICTGGFSYQTTGSTGDGYKFAADTGHRVTEILPALVPFRIEESWCADLMGLSLKNVLLRMICGKKEVYCGFGEMLFTHFGVSGPLILSASSFYQKEEATMLYLDLKPAMDEDQLDKRLLRDFEENKNRQFKNAVGGLFPIKMIPVMIRLSGINPEKKVNEISREERLSFVRLIKCIPLRVVGTGDFKEAIITRGGVSVKDINPSTMESKRVKNLYFAGEVLDVDALTGGFNLQIAWSTGHLAGENQKENLG